jgi:hypothetical protein
MAGRPKGYPKAGGRQLGTPNKATLNAREAIAAFVDDNAHKLLEWLDAMANDLKDDDGKILRAGDPKGAFQSYMSVIEYHIPKLARTEHAGDAEKPIVHTVKWGE